MIMKFKIILLEDKRDVMSLNYYKFIFEGEQKIRGRGKLFPPPIKDLLIYRTT